MKKILMTILFLLSFAGFAMAEDVSPANKIGIGFEEMKYGDLITGVSARGWVFTRVGIEGNIFYGKIRGSYEGNSLTTTFLEFEPKVSYAFLVNTYSKFYAGAKLGYGQLDLEVADYSLKKSVFNPGAFMGTEFSFSELPEIGFNIEIGYSRNLYRIEGLRLTVDGTSIECGLHYYF